MRRFSTQTILAPVVFAGLILGTTLHADDATPATIALIKSTITADALRADVAELSSDEMGGRFFRSPFAEKAAKWIQARFELIGLAPGAASDSYRQPIDKNVESGPNIIATYPGPGDGFIIVSSHYDHLRPKRTGEDKIFNGADDNASGVAGTLAVARAMKACTKAGDGAGCTIIFIAFNGEEAGLLGSSAYVKSPTVPLGQIRGVFNMDMISRGPPREIFIDGGKVGEPVVAALKKANQSIGLKLHLDEHPDWLDRSDQGPFLRKNVPAVLFSVEDHEDYHQVTDHVEKIDAGLAAEVAQLVALAAINMSHDAFTPRAEAPKPLKIAEPAKTEPVKAEPQNPTAH
ncbi:MAG: M28 family peptidase [Planctomycetota bacterium]|nr:M28 family peptidase [Planctomycetota bacterium]MDA1263172.1 M28 family peptidase [Planctomycetota bacterium]